VVNLRFVHTQYTNCSHFHTLTYWYFYLIFSNVNCFWRLEAPVGYIINLTFVDVHIQADEGCNRDVINVFDGMY